MTYRCDVRCRTPLAAVAAGLALLLCGCAGMGGDRAGNQDALKAEIRTHDLVLQPAGPCQYLATRQGQAGLDVPQVTYPGAHHGFDNPLLGPNPRRIPKALGGRGATTQYDPAGAEDSVRRVRVFLATHLEKPAGT